LHAMSTSLTTGFTVLPTTSQPWLWTLVIELTGG
jgi:hypothetical protein